MIENMMFNGMSAASPLQMNSGAAQVQETPGQAMEQFGSYLQDAISQVGAQEQQVHKMNDQFLVGKVDVDQLMIASEKSMLGLQLTAQVRNKAIEAYQEIMRTQL
ncbi:flagellar hook-basal body complex protein FliE [Paenibacillus bovis]|uniref:Flagellar hook-basal body complex protein FliE n=1 Tax=Paenibacillus bovis TaxID=1616788 RepID=A0A172ZFV4_9BACL|nr:flagellar hook-basal body complex protein FliE [Paenibacillus bovis]ANF96515.1 flagellar hook-basal body complex protein FliE [Paenibacillus bovis]